jgi:hypothetical protein
MSINLNNLITNDTNIIEIYLLSPLNSINKDGIINIYINNLILNKIKKNFKLARETTLVYFNRNNLSYVYDLSNDNQYVFLRKLENTIENNNLFAIAFNEMKMQSHSFACTNDINNRCSYKISEIKINNRISIIIKNNNLFIHYKHNKDVDIEKTNEIINSIIKKINSII